MENIKGTWVDVKVLTWAEAHKLGLTFDEYLDLKGLKPKKAKKVLKPKYKKKVLKPIEEKKDIEEIQDKMEQDWEEADKYNRSLKK